MDKDLGQAADKMKNAICDGIYEVPEEATQQLADLQILMEEGFKLPTERGYTVSEDEESKYKAECGAVFHMLTEALMPALEGLLGKYKRYTEQLTRSEDDKLSPFEEALLGFALHNSTDLSMSERLSMNQYDTFQEASNTFEKTADGDGHGEISLLCAGVADQTYNSIK